MVKALKQQLWVLGDDIITGYVLLFGGYLLGIILMQIILHTDKSVDTYFFIGTLCGIIGFCFYSLIVAATGFQQKFNIEISMGCTRRKFFLSYLTVSVLSNLLGVPLVLGLCRAENALYAFLYPQMTLEGEIDFLYYIVKIGFPAAFVFTIAGTFCGSMLLRFGRRAFWVFWAIWMVACIGGPQIHDAVTEAPNSLLGRLGGIMFRFVRTVPKNVWLMAAVISCILCLLISYLVVRKQQVN